MIVRDAITARLWMWVYLKRIEHAGPHPNTIWIGQDVQEELDFSFLCEL